MSNIFRNITQQTTIHGLRIAGFPKLNVFERLFWMFTITLATIGAVCISYSNWIRFLATPTVISLQKDYRNWENPFPAATACLLNKIDSNRATQYIFDTWHINSSNPSFDYYMNYLETIANISFFNLDNFAKFKNDKTLSAINMTDIAVKVHPTLKGTLMTSDTKRKLIWQMVLTEMGICYSLNSKFAHLFGVSFDKVMATENRDILHCHYLNGLCYARYDSDPSLPLKYYIHSYSDVLHTTMGEPLIINEGEEIDINYRMQQTESSKALKFLRPSQRRCRFDDEPISSDLPVYSSSICQIICRYKLSIKLCGCRPFFYHIFSGKLCDIDGLICLSKFTRNLTAPKLGCNCPEPCDVNFYFPQVPRKTSWQVGYFEKLITFRWGLLPPTTKIRRDVLFGFEDLVVSFGGTLALFLGVSFISLIETVFLILENIYLHFKNARQKNLQKVKPFKKNEILNN